MRTVGRSSQRPNRGSSIALDNILQNERSAWPQLEAYIRLSDKLIERGNQPGQQPLITKKFFIESWPNRSSEFDCTELNDLRRKGIFKGEYSCQGESVDDESRARRILARADGAWAALALGCLASFLF